MALTSAQLISRLFKRALGKSETNSGKTFFEESINTYNYTPTTSIWVDYNNIPNTAPVLASYGISGVVQYVSGLTLNSVVGTTNSFYDSGGTLKDIIPFNFGDGVSYNYAIKDSTGSPIVFGQGDWLLDTESGVLTFYGTVPSNMPPKISFYKYVGARSTSNIYLSSSYDSNDLYTSSYNLNAYSSNILYSINFLTGNTTTGTTLNINNLGAKSIKKYDVATSTYIDLAIGDIKVNSTSVVTYNDSEFRLLSVIATDSINYFITVFTGNENVINHNLGKYPNVTVLDSAGYKIEGQVRFISINSVELSFNNFNSNGSIICEV